MKKFASVIVAMLFVFSFAFSAFAAEKSDVEAKIESSVKYGYSGCFDEHGISVYDSSSYLAYLKSGDENALDYKDEYIKSVQELLVEDETAFDDICTLALVIQVYDLLGEESSSFAEKFEALKAGKGENPFTYSYAVETAKALGKDELAKSICDYMIENYYTLGVGTDFWGGWGTSADDLSVFILALSNYGEDYAEYIEDAVNLLETFACETGYGYGGAGNADSTAFALAAYSSIGNKKMADKAYTSLLSFFNEETGGFDGEWDSELSTRNAVFGLEYYLEIADENGAEKPESKPPVDKEDTKPNGSENDGAEKSPATGGTSLGIAASLAAASAAIIAVKKKSI